MQDIMILVILALCIAGVVYSMLKRKKKGVSSSCGSCSSCSHSACRSNTPSKD